MNMKKISICLLTFYMILAMAGCKTSSSDNKDSVRSEYPAIDESIEYASVVELTINPAFRFYLDENQNVIKVECLNDDANSVCKNLDLTKDTFDEAFSEILVESVNQGFLTNDKAVNVEVVKNNSNVYAPSIIQNTIDIVNAVAAANNLDCDCFVSFSDEIIEEQSNSWDPEDVELYTDGNQSSNGDGHQGNNLDSNSGNTCDLCGGKGLITCDLCNGTGTVIELEEHETLVRNNYVCPYCGGTGMLDDGLHGGQKAVCGHCGGDGKYGPESGDFRELAYDKKIVTEEVEKNCSRCNGAGTMLCPNCGGTGIKD